MQKAKKFDIEDSNIEMLGSQEDLDARKKKASLEPAWQGTGTEAGVWIWRIEKFEVKAWPKEEYGKFFGGDSYIVLHSQKVEDNEKLVHDIYFWIGAESSQDEYGTAAFKTVELDDYINYHHGSDPVQHREVEGSESPSFALLFPNLQVLQGGVDSGFRKVTPTEYKPRLLHVKGKKNCVVRQVELSAKSMNKGDSFILDNGMKIYQWNGSAAGMMEKTKAAQLLREIDDERSGRPETICYDEKTSPPGKEFWDLLGGKSEIAAAIPDQAPIARPKSLHKISDETGELKMTKLASVDPELLDTKDVFLLDAGNEVFVWIGKEATEQERANGLAFGTKYLSDNKRPKATPICRIIERAETSGFKLAIGMMKM